MCGLTANHTDLLVLGMAAPCQVQRQPTGYSAGQTMVPSRFTNATEWRVLLANNSQARWATPSEVQEKNTGKTRWALVTCVECSHHIIVYGLIVDHTDLSLLGMAAPSWD